MGQLTISMAIFNSYVKLPEGIDWVKIWMIHVLKSRSPFFPD